MPHLSQTSNASGRECHGIDAPGIAPTPRRVAGWLGWLFVALTAAFLTGCQPAKPTDFGFCPCPGCCVVGR
jgi:hypothetical protein